VLLLCQAWRMCCHVPFACHKDAFCHALQVAQSTASSTDKHHTLDKHSSRQLSKLHAIKMTQQKPKRDVAEGEDDNLGISADSVGESSLSSSGSSASRRSMKQVPASSNSTAQQRHRPSDDQLASRRSSHSEASSSSSSNSTSNTSRPPRTSRSHSPLFTQQHQQHQQSPPHRQRQQQQQQQQAARQQPAPPSSQQQPDINSLEDLQRKLTYKISSTRDLFGLRYVIQQYEPYFNSIHCTAAVCRTVQLLKGRQLPPAEMRLLSYLTSRMPALVKRHLPTFQERAIANVLHALARLDITDREVVAELAESAGQRLTSFDTQGLANVLWALAKLQYSPPTGWLQTYLQVAAAKMSAFKPQELSNIAWALATLKHRPSSGWMSAFLAAAQQQHSSFTPQGLTVVMWSLAQLDYVPSADWMASATAAAKAGIDRYSAHALAMGIWSFAALGHGLSEDVMHAFTRRLQARMHDCNATDLGMVLWAAAQLQSKHKLPGALIAALLDRCYLLTQEFSTRQQATMLWSLAKLQVSATGCRRCWWLHVHTHVDCMCQQQGIATMLPAVAAVSASPVPAPDVLMRCCPQLLTLLPILDLLLTPHHVIPDPQVQPHHSWMKNFLRCSLASMDGCSPQDLANMVWALATLGVTPSEQWQAALQDRLQWQVGCWGHAQCSAAATAAFCWLLVSQSFWCLHALAQ
jgi:hypothetical protein